mgnify:CR=1 FL=1
MVIPIHFKCKNCGLVFGAVVSEEELEKIPCPGCGGHALERTETETDYYLLSRAAEQCSGDCACCKANCANRT